MHDKTELSGSFILAPVPVVLVACSHEELGRNVLTIAWCGINCSDPETVHVSIRPERFSYRMISESGCFTVNMPTVEMTKIVDMCGIRSGREFAGKDEPVSKDDKFDLAALTAAPAKIVQAPLVAECPVNLECEVKNVIPVGVHHMFVGEVVAKHADSEVMTDGKLDFSRIPLITYVNGEYWSLGQPVGRYGFSKKT
jgi:flavin reductase (DIM6/NTAB) family NADH-FMN oxidoreductase RutF